MYSCVNSPFKYEKFAAISNISDDGKMQFDYLVNPGYANSILTRYYINDDKKLNDSRTIPHPYQIKHSSNGIDKYYGSLFWNKTLSDSVYKDTGIRL